MKYSSCLVFAIAVVLIGPSASAAEPSPERIVSVGGPLTEVVFALGAGGNVVAVDTSSLYPRQVVELPKVGYQRSLSAEGILSLRPDLVLATDEAGPPAVLEQLRNAGIRLALLPAPTTAASTRAMIRGAATALHRETEAATLLASLDAALAEAAAAVPIRPAPKVLFVYARGAGSVLVSGRGTTVAELIALAGGRNAIVAFDGFKPLSAEAALLADPDVLLVSERGLESLGGLDGMLALPGLDRTRAAAQRRVATIDDALLLGFGPRLGDAIAALRRQLNPPVPE